MEARDIHTQHIQQESFIQDHAQFTAECSDHCSLPSMLDGPGCVGEPVLDGAGDALEFMFGGPGGTVD